MRLIDADILMKIVDSEIERVEEEMRDAEERPNLYTDEFRKHKSYTVAGMAHIAQDILEAPTLDAVPVVRCKDCKWWTKQEKSIQGRCALNGMYPTGGWYCANGRREDDD